MNILVYEWHAYNYKDIEETLRAMGHDVDVLKYHLDNYDEDEAFYELLSSKIKSSTYDFVFTVNYFGVVATVCHDIGIRYVSWTCDNPLISMYHNSVFYDTNLIFTFDKTNEIEWKQMGVKNIFYLPLCGEPGRMKAAIDNAPSEKRGAYRAPVSFVGSLYERNSYDALESSLYDYERGYFDAMIEAQKNLYKSYILDSALTPDILASVGSHIDLKESSEDSFSDISLILETTVLGFKVAKERRIDLLNFLTDNDVETALYSNSDATLVPNVSYRGSVDYFGELPLVFSESDININNSLPIIKSGIPLRIWDVLSAGGFLLTDYKPELLFYFENKKELCFYESKEELLSLIEYYLSHDTEREKIRRNGLECVQKYHTYRERLSSMLSEI